MEKEEHLGMTETEQLCIELGSVQQIGRSFLVVFNAFSTIRVQNIIPGGGYHVQKRMSFCVKLVLLSY